MKKITSIIVTIAVCISLSVAFASITIEKVTGEVVNYTFGEHYIEIELSEFTGIFNFDPGVEETLVGENLPKAGSKVEFEYYDEMGSSLITHFKVLTNKNQEESKTFLAKASVVSVIVNDKETKFDVYLLNGNTYFKLKDLAYALNKTDKAFNVSWNNNVKAIDLKTGTSFVDVNYVLSTGCIKDANALLNRSPVCLNGEEIDVVAYTINGLNYFKLRDLADILSIELDWDNQLKCIKMK